MKNIIILAAGKGTRMKSDLPKCACPLLGKPMIKYLIESCIEANIVNIIVVVGYKGEIIKEILSEYPNIKFAYQNEQLGTGHACMMAESLLKDKSGSTIIVPGDMPLIGKDNLINLYNHYNDYHSAMTILSSIFENPFGYGRIVRCNGNVTFIKEESDATTEEKLIKEINTGLYVVDNKKLFYALSLIDNNNKKNEYYLTDIVKIISKDNVVDAVVVPYDYHLIGINDQNTLLFVENEFKNAVK